MPDVPLHSRRPQSARWAIRVGLLVLAAAIALSIASFGRLRETLVTWWNRGPQQDDTEEIVVAKEPIPAYSTIYQSKLQLLRRKKEHLPASAIRNAKDAINRVLVQDLPANEPILEEYLAKSGSLPGIAGALKHGWGTVTFDASRVGGPVRLLQRGSAVAVLATWDPPPGKEGAVPLTSICCQGAEVLMPALPHPPEAKSPVTDQVTLQMPADDVVKVTEAAGRARLTLVALPRLPGPTDPKLQGSTIRPQTDLTPYIEVIRGSQSSMQGPSPAERKKLMDEPMEDEPPDDPKEPKEPKEGDK